MEILLTILAIVIIIAKVFEIVSRIRNSKEKNGEEINLMMFLILVLNMNSTNRIIENLMFIISILIIFTIIEMIFKNFRKKNI